MIQVTNAVKRFDGFTALDGASITVPDGAIYGLVGPNGAGKSTLIRHLTGILRLDEGEILVDGEPIYENPAKKALLAVIPDDWYYFSSASLRDMMRFFTPPLTWSATRSSGRSSRSRRRPCCGGSARACRSRRPSGWP